MIEIERTATPALMGTQGPITLGAGYTTNLGFTFPLLVPALATVISGPLMVAGVNSFMLHMESSVIIAGQVIISVVFLRPDLTQWASTSTAALANFGTVAVQVVAFGDRGTDQTANIQGYCSSLFSIGLRRNIGLDITFTKITLFVMTRP